jgi:hypothetical protein
VALAGGEPTPFAGPVAPQASLVQPAPFAEPTADAAQQQRTPGPSRTGRAPVAARSAARGTTPRLSAIDKLLADGTGAQVLIPALARLERPEEVLRVVLERALGWRGRGPLPAPVRHLVEQVQAASAGEQEQPRGRRQGRDEPRRQPLRRARPAARTRGAHTPATKAAATVHHVQADLRIAGLVKKLEQLIHLVDVEHRLATARSQVRMAEDSPAARSPGSVDASPEAQASQAGQDVDTLVQTIVEFVNEEMSLYSMRRPEDPGNRTPWF